MGHFVAKLPSTIKVPFSVDSINLLSPEKRKKNQYWHYWVALYFIIRNTLRYFIKAHQPSTSINNTALVKLLPVRVKIMRDLAFFSFGVYLARITSRVKHKKIYIKYITIFYMNDNIKKNKPKWWGSLRIRNVLVL